MAREEGEREGKGMGMREGLRAGRKEGMELGIEKGEKKSKEEMAKALLGDGVAIDVISKASGLSETEIRAL